MGRLVRLLAPITVVLTLVHCVEPPAPVESRRFAATSCTTHADCDDKDPCTAGFSSCVWIAGSCAGAGWQRQRPACGMSGSFVQCVKKPGVPPCGASASIKAQACR